MVNLCLKSYTYCPNFILFLHMLIQIHKAPEYGSIKDPDAQVVKQHWFYYVSTLLFRRHHRGTTPSTSFSGCPLRLSSLSSTTWRAPRPSIWLPRSENYNSYFVQKYQSVDGRCRYIYMFAPE